MHQQNIQLQQLHALLAQAEVLRLSERAQERLRWFIHYVEHNRSIASTCEHFQISRATFQRWLERFNPHDPSTLEERSHHPHAVRQSLVPNDVIEFIRTYRKSDVHMGKERIADLLWSEHQVLLSASTVGRIIERECLYFDTTPHHWKKRVSRDLRESGTELSQHLPDPTRDRIPDPPPIVSQPISEPATTTVALSVSEEKKEMMQTPLIKEEIPTVSVSTIKESETSKTGGCENCIFCRMKSWNWRPVRRALLAVSLLINVAVLLSVLAGTLWHGQADTAHANNGEALQIVTSASDSPTTTLDAR